MEPPRNWPHRETSTSANTSPEPPVAASWLLLVSCGAGLRSHLLKLRGPLLDQCQTFLTVGIALDRLFDVTQEFGRVQGLSQLLQERLDFCEDEIHFATVVIE